VTKGKINTSKKHVKKQKIIDIAGQNHSLEAPTNVGKNPF
jgi:hypothetical protein